MALQSLPEAQLRHLLNSESGWVEWKRDNTAPDMIGQRLSGLSNSTVLADQPYGFMVWGVADNGEVVACYQHAVLLHTRKETLSNISLRERFALGIQHTSAVSSVIKKAVETGLIKAESDHGTSRKFARYVPYWAG